MLVFEWVVVLEIELLVVRIMISLFMNKSVFMLFKYWDG